MAGGYNYGSSSGGGYSYGGSGSLIPKLTAIQAAEVQAAKAKSAQHTILGDLESTGSGLFHGSTSALGAALGYLARPAAAIDTGLTLGAKAGDDWNLKTLGAFAHGLKLGIEGKSHDTFSDFIRAKYPQFAAHHKTATALGGFAGTVLTDPTLPLIIGAQAIPGVNATVDEVEAARLASILGTAGSSTERAAQAQKALDAIEKAVGPATDHNFTARKVLAQLDLQAATDEMTGKLPNLATLTKRAAADAAAKVETEQSLRNVIQAKYSIPFSGGKAIPLTPAVIAGKRVAPLVPSLARTADAGIPLVSRGADVVGQVFKHGWGQEAYAKPALAASTKAKQYIQDAVMHGAYAVMGPHFKALKEDQMLKAIDFGETRQGIVKVGGGGRRINEPMLAKAVRHGELSGEQAAFLRDWHGTMEGMRKMEVSFGIKHKGDIGNIVYVPHRYMRDGGTATKAAVQTEFGLAKERQNLTLANIVAAQGSSRAASKNLSIVTSPEEILGRRAAESANASSQHALAEVLAHTAGVPAKIPDVERRSKALGRVRKLKKKQRGLTHIHNMKGTKRSLYARHAGLTRAAVKKVLDRHAPKFAKIDAKMTEHMEAARITRPHVPAFTKARAMSQKSFKESIAHFNPQDRIAAIQLHGRMSEGRRLESKLTKLGSPKGGPQKAAKALAVEVEHYRHSLLPKAQRGAQDVTGPGKRTIPERAMGASEGQQGKMFQRVETPASAEARDTFTGASMKPSARGESWKGNIKATLDAQRSSLQGEYNKLIGKYQAGGAYDHGKAVKRLLAQREREMGRVAADVNVVKERLRVKKVAAEEEWQKTFDRQAKLYTSYERQIAKEQRAYGAVKNNPDVPAGWVKLDKNLGGEKYHFRPEIHEALTNIERANNNKNIMRSITNGWMKLMRTWKIGVTSVNPGYRVRNTASDVWNMYIAGVPMPRVVQYGAKAGRLQVLAHRAGMKLARGETDLSPDELASLRALAEMQLHGILSGLFQGDIQEVSRMFHAGTRARDYINGINPINLGKAYVKATQDWNRHIENWGRVTHYLYRREYQGLSAQWSADWVKRAHFDYEELTPTEQNLMKGIFPFYTWTRKNIPYQLTQMVNRPGKYAAFGHAIQTSNELATGNPHTPDDQAGTLPSWMRQDYMFRVPGFGDNAYLNPNIGVQDISSIEHPLQQGLAQHVNPAFQIAATVLTGKNVGTGQDIVGTHPRNPVSGIGADILRMFPGSNVGPTERTVRGKVEQGVGANPWYTFAAQQLPGLNFVVNQTASIKQKQRGGAGLAPLGYLGGVGVYNRDLNAEATSAQLQFQDDMKKAIRGLRDTGKLAPSRKHKSSPFQAALNQLIAQGG